MKKAIGVDNTVRQKWNKDEFKKKAEEREAEEDETADMDARELKKRKRQERDPLHQGLIAERAALKSREFKLNLDARLGKTQVIGNTTALSQQAGYYCSVCDCVLKDSITYLDHINGKWHQRALGMSMRVEKSTGDQIKSRLQQIKEREEQRKSLKGKDAMEMFNKQVETSAKEEEERRQQEFEEKRRRKEEERRREEEEAGGDDDIARIMGFGSFGGKK